MRKTKSVKQQDSREKLSGKTANAMKKPVSDSKIKMICIFTFTLVALGGIYINLAKSQGVSGFSLPFFGGGGQSKEAQRKEIMNSDISDELKVLKLQRLAQQK
jgi:hypothetical protein